MVRRAPLPPKQQFFHPVQRRGRTAVSRGRGQAYNLTTEEAKTSEEVITNKITVYSKHVLALFDSGTSYCFISDNFTALHSIHVECLDNQ